MENNAYLDGQEESHVTLAKEAWENAKKESQISYICEMDYQLEQAGIHRVDIGVTDVEVNKLALQLAERYRDSMREDPTNHVIEGIDAALEIAQKTREDIGLSDPEVSSWHESIAKMYLKKAREDTVNADTNIFNMDLELKSAGKTRADIGVEEEVQTILKKRKLLRAENVWKHVVARSKYPHPTDDYREQIKARIDEMKETLDSIGKSPDDIGVKEEDIQNILDSLDRKIKSDESAPGS